MPDSFIVVATMGTQWKVARAYMAQSIGMNCVVR